MGAIGRSAIALLLGDIFLPLGALMSVLLTLDRRLIDFGFLTLTCHWRTPCEATKI